MTKATYLSIEQILAASDIQTEDVYVPEWGGTVRVRGLTAKQRADWQRASLVQRGRMSEVNFQATTIKLVALSVVDADGKPMFSEEHTKLLANKSSAALERIADVAMRLSGIGESDLEELSKNSDPSLNGDSP